MSFLLYLLYLFFENLYVKKQRKKIKCIIHVNGIRGKSTVSRLIDAGLRSAGYRVFTKTTGTSPRIIDVNAIEFEINRQGKANIREQIQAIKWACKQKAEILIVECMAVKPELQFVCEHNILQSNIAVITNVREDHVDEMGTSLDTIAAALSNTIPKNATFFTADQKYFDFFKSKCKEKGTKAFLSLQLKDEYWTIDFPSNVALAIDICKHLGIDEKKSFAAMKNYYKDPGSLKILSYINRKNHRIFFVNTLAANDPHSTEIILERITTKHYWNNKKYLLINNRADRVSRLEQYVNFAIKFEHKFDNILVFGENKNLFCNYLLRNKLNKNKIEILLNETYFEHIEEDCLIFAAGNICRAGKNLVDYFEKRGKNIDDT